jgi:hypothetical protein
MSPTRHHRRRPGLERLEARLALSLPPSAPTYGLTPPANTIGLSLGNATRPGSSSATTVMISPQNITAGKATTEFAVFVRPYGDSGIVPKIVGVEQNGQELPAQHGRSYTPTQAGQPTNQSAVFFETGQPGTVTILVSGRGLSTGAYTVETTLTGDVNGDGVVNLADAQAFAPAYVSKPRDRQYNPAADYNQNGIINLYDALAMQSNMTPLTKPAGGWAAINLVPNQQIQFSGPKNSGGTTFDKNITIAGYTTPGSIVLVDSTAGDYRFASEAVSTDANGFFSVPGVNTQGVNTYNFKILDPFGHQYIRSFPVYWIPYAVPNSKYQYKPSKKTSGGGRIGGTPPVGGGLLPGAGPGGGTSGGGTGISSGSSRVSTTG